MTVRRTLERVTVVAGGLQVGYNDIDRGPLLQPASIRRVTRISMVLCLAVGCANRVRGWRDSLSSGTNTTQNAMRPASSESQVEHWPAYGNSIVYIEAKRK